MYLEIFGFTHTYIYIYIHTKTHFTFFTMNCARMHNGPKFHPNRWF